MPLGHLNLLQKMRLRSWVLLGLLVWGWTLGCDGTSGLSILSGGASRNQNSSGAAMSGTAEEAIVVVGLINASAVALDVQFFVSTDPAVTTEGQLFVEENAFRDGIGFLSKGVLAAGESVDLSIPCQQVLFVGTAGGEFLDPQTGVSLGQGSNPRSAALGPQFDCGDRITFRFFANPEGQPNVTLGIE